MRPRDPFTSPRFGQIATFMLLPAALTALLATNLLFELVCLLALAR